MKLLEIIKSAEQKMPRSLRVLSWAVVMSILFTNCAGFANASTSAESVRLQVGAVPMQESDSNVRKLILSGGTSEGHGNLNVGFIINGSEVAQDTLSAEDNQIGPVVTGEMGDGVIESFIVVVNGIPMYWRH